MASPNYGDGGPGAPASAGYYYPSPPVPERVGGDGEEVYGYSGYFQPQLGPAAASNLPGVGQGQGQGYPHPPLGQYGDGSEPPPQYLPVDPYGGDPLVQGQQHRAQYGDGSEPPPQYLPVDPYGGDPAAQQYWAPEGAFPAGQEGVLDQDQDQGTRRVDGSEEAGGDPYVQQYNRAQDVAFPPSQEVQDQDQDQDQGTRRVDGSEEVGGDPYAQQYRAPDGSLPPSQEGQDQDQEDQGTRRVDGSEEVGVVRGAGAGTQQQAEGSAGEERSERGGDGAHRRRVDGSEEVGVVRGAGSQQQAEGGDGDERSERGGDGSHRRRGKSQRYPSDYEDDSEDEDYDRRRRRDRRKERDWDRDYDYDAHRSSFRRGGPGPGPRESSRRERDRDFDSLGRHHHHRGPDYDFYDNEYDRPRSRTSYHEDEYYSSRRRRRMESDSVRARGPPSEYGANTTRGAYSRQGYDYAGYAPQSASFSSGPRNRGVGGPVGSSSYFEPPPQQNVTAQTQSFQMYLAAFRTQNPAQYREWYHRYLAHMQDPVRIPFPPVPGYPGIPALSVAGAGAVPTDRSRPPSRSGRSSAIDDNTPANDSALFRPIQETPREPSPPARNTPLIFSTPHAIGRISSLGYVYRVRNKYGSSNVELMNIKGFMKKLPEYKEMKAFPGPLVKDVVHKNTIISFCQRKIKDLEHYKDSVDHENLILLWELLILLLRQNGSAVGSDIAELLLKSKSNGRALTSGTSASVESDNSEPNSEDEGRRRKSSAVNSSQVYVSNDNDKQSVEIFCEKLIYGHRKEALEFAMDNSLWGHALFFSSKMDEKLHGTVLARFANATMSLNSPLQTLFHVLSGKQPPSVTCCGDDSFGDWKPHLAMILSNMGQRPEFEANSMRTLGRTLANKNMKFAAQFCYLMAESEFTDDSDIGPLLGFSQNNVLEATQMTEIYEFARCLANPGFSLGSAFVERKLNYTKELINLGCVQEAYSYCEEMTKSLKKNRVNHKEQSLARSVLYLAERLVNCDVNRGTEEPNWINDLRKMTEGSGNESESTSRRLSLTSTSDHIDDGTANVQQPYNPTMYESHPHNQQYDGAYSEIQTSSVPLIPNSNNVTTVQQPSVDNVYQPQWSQPELSNGYSSGPHVQRRNSQQSEYTQPQPHSYATNYLQPNMSAGPSVTTSDNNNYWQPNEPPKLSGGSDASSMAKTSSSQYQPSAGSQPVAHKAEKKRPKEDSKPQKKGFLSGMFSALTFRPKNQMILPDDKDPSIVWDEATKSWKNTNGDEDEDSAPKGPPPKDSDLMGHGSGPPSIPSSSVNNVPQQPNHVPSAYVPNHSQSQQPANPALGSSLPNTHLQPKLNGGPVSKAPDMPPAPTGQNKFQRPKGIKPRNNYVDLFNTNNNNNNLQSKPDAPPVPFMPTPSPGSGIPNIFMPPPAPADSGPTSFLTATDNPGDVQDDGQSQPQAPPMFNPAQFQGNQSIPSYGINR